MMSLHLVGGILVPYENQEKSHVGGRMIMASGLIATRDLLRWISGCPSCQQLRSNPPKGRFNGLASGKAHSCGVRVGGQVECWGSNECAGLQGDRLWMTLVYFGQIGDGKCG